MAEKINENYKEGNYEFYILQVMKKVCEKDKYPIKQKYAEAIAEYRNENDPSMQNSMDRKVRFTAENVRPNLSRALDRLCDKKMRQLCAFAENTMWLMTISICMRY
jgi:hypothetical protein